MKISELKMEGPRHPTVKEYPAFLYFLSQAYGFSDLRWFENDTSFFYGTRPDQLKTKWAFKAGNQFASHVGLFPFVSLVEGRKLKIGGIGSVATHPDFRGRGLMKRLMEYVDGQMAKDGYDLGLLWGERALYRPFGYERGVFQDRFSFNRKLLKTASAGKGVRPAKTSDGPSIQRLYLKHSFRTERSGDYFKALYRRFNRGIVDPVWVLEKSGKVAAYVIVFKMSDSFEMAEWGGAAKDVASLLISVLHKQTTDTLWASIYPGSDLYPWALQNHDNQTKTTSSCMVKVFNLGKVLKAFEPQLQRRYEKGVSKISGSVTLSLENQEKVKISLGRKLQIEAGGRGDQPISLTQAQCVRLLFGGGRPSEELGLQGPAAGLLDSLFPLQWYWWRSDWI